MAIARIRAAFDYPLETVWKVVTSLEDTSWRSDIAGLDILKPGKTFVEHTPDGIATTFTVTALEPCRRYAFDIENSNMKGCWTGLFSEEEDLTVLEFIEDVQAKKLYMKPFVTRYLKKQQEGYIADLRKKLDRSET